MWMPPLDWVLCTWRHQVRGHAIAVSAPNRSLPDSSSQLSAFVILRVNSAETCLLICFPLSICFPQAVTELNLSLDSSLWAPELRENAARAPKSLLRKESMHKQMQGYTAAKAKMHSSGS